jgi:hypothetical protein
MQRNSFRNKGVSLWPPPALGRGHRVSAHNLQIGIHQHAIETRSRLEVNPAMRAVDCDDGWNGNRNDPLRQHAWRNDRDGEKDSENPRYRHWVDPTFDLLNGNVR